MNIALPQDPGDILNGRGNAVGIVQYLHTAYWLHSRDKETALFLLNSAHNELRELAAAMGYTLTPIGAEVAA
jgi:hypothetical protein